jgi:peptidoglycan/xylan/chitin deacetylase (PgdA/CDA1 family)
MGLLQALKDTWRKNAPEVIGLFDGSMPDFVTAARPREPLGGVPVFCYHLVEAQQLGADLEFLRRNGYHTLAADEFLEHVEGTRQIPDRSVLLSFDDGPRNFFDVAFPLLKEFGAQAIHFIAPGLHADSDQDDGVEDRPMTWQELLTIHRSGLVRFQSHTLESRYVPRWPMPAALAGCEPRIENSRRRAALNLAEDFAQSKRALEAKLPGLIVNHLSFPMYLGTEGAVEIARAQGFRACHWGYLPRRPLNKRGESPFFISRMSDEFVRRLPGMGRVGFAQLLRERARRVQMARAWRRRFAPSAA